MPNVQRRPAILWAVPIGTAPSRCRCGCTVFRVERLSRGAITIDCTVVGGKAPAAGNPGLGVPHRALCALAGEVLALTYGREPHGG